MLEETFERHLFFHGEVAGVADKPTDNPSGCQESADLDGSSWSQSTSGSRCPAALLAA